MENSDLYKKFYKISDVEAIVGVTASTLRFWEKYFPAIKPRRNAKNIRHYTPTNIEYIRKVKYLLHEKGLKIEAAQMQLRVNRANVDLRFEVVERLKDIKGELVAMLDAIDKVE
ncbi:MAG: MerR family transcriptional regulator [Muribaculaceae bacterium]